MRPIWKVVGANGEAFLGPLGTLLILGIGIQLGMLSLWCHVAGSVTDVRSKNY